MIRSSFLIILVLSLAAPAEEPSEAPLQQVVFGSCCKGGRPVPALAAAAELNPEVFIWMGDNIYGDSEDVEVLRKKYEDLLELPDYAKLRESVTIIGTWDDHDYGLNDIGKEFVSKVGSQQAFLDFIGEPADSPRREQEGVYGLHDFGPEGKQVRFILLDTRYHRDKVGSDGDMLGEAQWKWLEEALVGSKAEVNVVVSSIQVLPSQHRFEHWSRFPAERKRLFELLSREDVPPVLLLSGDRHLAEITLDSESCGYPLYEITSSSLNQPLGGTADEANDQRVGRNYRPVNFGTLSFDWSRDVPLVTACIRDVVGVPQRAVTVEMAK